MNIFKQNIFPKYLNYNQIIFCKPVQKNIAAVQFLIDREQISNFICLHMNFSNMYTHNEHMCVCTTLRVSNVNRDRQTED